MLFDFDKCFDRPERPEPEAGRLAGLIAQLRPGNPDYFLHPLSGGYRNFNYRLDTAQGSYVLRLCADQADCARELALLERLSREPVPVPAVYAQLPGAALLEFCQGTLASQLPNLTAEELRQLGAAIGASLARIHQLSFPGAGFFNSSLEIVEALEPFAAAWLGYTRSVLQSDRARQRAGPGLCDALLELLTQQGPRLEELVAVNRLVHSDFNLKNLLVLPAEKHGKTDWQVSAVLDWEFAHAGSPLSDLGNFFRFEEQLPPPLLAGFLEGYQEGAGPLSPDWRKLSLLLDLAALCGFLDTPEERPRSFATARDRLQRSLDCLKSE